MVRSRLDIREGALVVKELKTVLFYLCALAGAVACIVLYPKQRDLTAYEPLVAT